MAYVIDPHLAFSDRVARLLRQRDVPQKQCRLSDAWLCFVEAVRAYDLWPLQRTAYRYTFTHEDGGSGPVTVVRWSVYFEHVNRLGERTAVSFASLTLETPLVIAWRNHDAVTDSKAYANPTEWLRAVQKDSTLNQVVRADMRWTRKLSAEFID